MADNNHYNFNRSKISEIYQTYDAQFINNIASIIEPHCEQIADRFYEVMLKNPRAKKFLDSNTVNNRLRQSMTTWVRELFIHRSDNAIDRFIEKQKIIGDVHERIEMPMLMVDYGVLVIKEEINTRLQNSFMNREDISNALIFVSKLIDYVTVIINESFVDNSIDHERRSELLQKQSINANLAYECAQLRSALSSWFCEVLIALHKRQAIQENNINIWRSNVGMWVRHKAKTIFADSEESVKIDAKMTEIEENLKNAIMHHGNDDHEQLVVSIEELNKHVSETDWLIESLEKTAIEQEKGRDVLTNLFNRRYLPNIIKSEMKFNRKKNAQFAILYIDIDNFKGINDEHGHKWGDYVLNEVSYILLHSVRVGDYVFRYGGEEFLILVTEANIGVAMQVAENLRARIESHCFALSQEKNIGVTLSIGVAMSGDEKDFEKIIKMADDSLLRAKHEGKNRCVLSGQDPG